MKTLLFRTIWGYVRTAIEANSEAAVVAAIDKVVEVTGLDRARVDAFVRSIAAFTADALDLLEAYLFGLLAARVGIFGCDSPDCPCEGYDDVFEGLTDAIANEVTDAEVMEAMAT